MGTQGPGDVWSWQLNGTTFTASDQTIGTTYSGTESTLSTGFLKLTVTSTNDPNVSDGQSFYAIELPGTALLLKEAGADTKQPIVAGALGSDPAGPTVSFNYVSVGAANFNAATDDAFGDVTFNVSGNNYTGTSSRYLIDGTQLSDGQADFTGNNGEMTDLNVPGGGTATGAMTPSGVCVIDYGPNNGGVIGVMQPASNVNLATIGSLSFRGFLINQGKTQPVAVTPNGDGTLHGAGYELPSGVETGTFDPNGSGVTVTFTGQPHPGEVTTSIATTGGTDTVVAAVNQVGGKYMLFAFGVGSDGTPYNIVLMQD